MPKLTAHSLFVILPMQRQVIINISCLANVRTESHILRGKELAELPCINDAYLIIEDGVIAEYGEMKDIKSEIRNDDQKPKTENSHLNESVGEKQHETINANNATILPCWCDSHTHLVFAASREAEFIDKIKGKSYAEIASKGGGILNSARKLNETSEEDFIRRGVESFTGIN